MSTRTVSELGEGGVIARIRQRVPAAAPGVVLGIGDDAAVLEPDRGRLTVLTTDASVEGIHFDVRFCPLPAVGHRALAANLSDLAAMGATPRHVLLSLALPPHLEVVALDGLLDGLCALADRERVTVVGGNVTTSPGPLVVDITAVGSVRRRRVLTRSGARAGDLLYVSGDVGAAAAGLLQLQEGLEAREAYCVDRYLRPEARMRLGTQIGQHRAARAAIDLSDGLADAVTQIAEASGLGAAIDADRLPLLPETHRAFEAAGLDPISSAVAGGDEYELLVAVGRRDRRRLEAARRRAGKPRLTAIGVLTEAPDVVLRREGRETPLPRGYQHLTAAGSSDATPGS